MNHPWREDLAASWINSKYLIINYLDQLLKIKRFPPRRLAACITEIGGGRDEPVPTFAWGSPGGSGTRIALDHRCPRPQQLAAVHKDGFVVRGIRPKHWDSGSICQDSPGSTRQEH